MRTLKGKVGFGELLQKGSSYAFKPFCSCLGNKDTRSGGLKALKLGLFLERAKGNPKKQGGEAVLRSKILTTRSADSIWETLRFQNPSASTKYKYFIKV